MEVPIVLHVADNFGTDQTNMHGGAHLFANWLPYANRRGGYRHELCSLRFRNAAARALEAHGITAHYLETGRFNPVAIWRLWRLVRRKQPHLLHLHQWGSQAIGRIVARLCGVPTILHIHMADSPVPGYVRFLNRALERYTTRAIAVSEAAKRFGIERLGIREEKISVIANGVTLDRFSPRSPEERTEARNQLGIPADRLVVGCVGRLESGKGQEILLRALPQAVRYVPHILCVLVGDGRCRQALEQLVDQLGIRLHVRIAGYVPEVHRWFATFDLHVVPSLFEGFCLVAVEAMACGLPQVVTRVGALPEILEEGQTGYFVTPGDPGALAERVVALLRDPDARVRMGDQARAAAARYGIETMSERIESLYTSILSRRYDSGIQYDQHTCGRLKSAIVSASGGLAEATSRGHEA